MLRSARDVAEACFDGGVHVCNGMFAESAKRITADRMAVLERLTVLLDASELQEPHLTIARNVMFDLETEIRAAAEGERDD